MIAAILIFYPVATNTLAGFKSVKREKLELMRSLAASRYEIYKKLLIPSSMPYFFTGLKISAPMAITASILVDTLQGGGGLGCMLSQSLKHAMSIFVFWQIVFLSAIVGILSYYLMSVIEKTSAHMTEPGTLTRSAVNINGTQLGMRSLKNIVVLLAAYDFIRSTENGLSSVKPRYAFTLIATVHNSITTSILATMLRTSALSLTSLVRLLIMGAMAIMGTALNAATMVSPPLPHLGNTVAITPSKYPSSEPAARPQTATITVAHTFCIIDAQLSVMMRKANTLPNILSAWGGRSESRN